MENELKLEVLRSGANEEFHETGKGPWVVRRMGGNFSSQEELTITNAYDGSSVLVSMSKQDDLPIKPHKIFGFLIEDIRGFVRKEKVKIYLYNEWGQLLRLISPEHDIGLYESQLTIRNAYDGKEISLGSLPHEDDRPICPNCNKKAGLEPAHWTHPKDNAAQWRWVCVDCDYAVSCDTDNEFSPTGRLASRKMRRTRSELRKVFSRLWESGLMEKGYAYKLLEQLFTHKKGERVNFATMSVLQMQKAADYANDIMKDKVGEDQAEWAGNEMKQLYSAITHEQGEPTYLGDDVYLFPDGRVGGL